MINKKINVNTKNIFIVVLMAIFFIASVNTVSAITALRILDSSVYPNVASPGDTLTFVYSINNPSTSNVNNVRLGAQIRTYSPQGVWIDDWANDKVEIIYPGTRDYSRSFKVPSTAILGLYDANWVILDHTTSVWYHSRLSSPILTIQANTGTLSVTTTPVSGNIYVDGYYKGAGSWSGSINTGNHIVSYGAVSGYTTPSQQTVTVNKGQTTPVTGTYVSIQTTGTLSVTTTPVSGNIYVDGNYKGAGSWSGPINTGNYIVSYGAVSGYSTPPQKTVTVYTGQTTPVTGTYVSNTVTLSVSPTSGQQGTNFHYSGSHFTPNGVVEFHVVKPNGVPYPPSDLAGKVDASGNFNHDYLSHCGSMVGIHTIWAIDRSTGKRSNDAIQNTLASSSCTPQITSISPTQIVGSTFDLTINGNNFDSGAVDSISWKANGNFVGNGTILSRTNTQIIVREFMTGANPGVYLVRVNNSGGQPSNGVDLTITSTNPTMAVSPTSGQQGTNFHYSGSHFTPNGVVEFHVVKPDGVPYPPSDLTGKVDASGNFNHDYLSHCGSMVGIHTIWAIDRSTGKRSNDAFQTTLASSSCTPQITSINPTQIVGSTFDLTINGNNFDTGAVDSISWKADGHFVGNGTILSRTNTQIMVREFMTGANPGVYLVRVNNSGGQPSNGVDLTITSTNPTMAVSPTSGQQGTNFHYSGSHFTPNGVVEFHVVKPDGVPYPPSDLTGKVDASGNFNHDYLSHCGSMVGIHTIWAIDRSTGKKSNDAFQTTLASSTCTPQITTINPTQVVGSTFDLTINGNNFDSGAVDSISWKADGHFVGNGTILSRTNTQIIVREFMTGANPGVYLVRVNNSGGQPSNGVDLTLTITSTNPTMAVSPTSGQQGTTFHYSGSHFTPNGVVEFHVVKPDGVPYPPSDLTGKVDASGNFNHDYLSHCGSMVGIHTIWAIDRSTGKRSNDAFQTTLASSSCTPQITSISPTQIVGSTFDLTIDGNNFDSGAIDQIYWKANGNFIGQGVIISRTSTQIISRQSMTNIADGIYSVKIKNSNGQYSNGVDLVVGGSDGATFITETYKDNSVVPPSQTFTKTWTLKNSGTTTWGSGYKLMYVSGSLHTSQADVMVIGSVSPGQSYQFNVPMKAPTTPNTYTEYWKLVNPQGTTIPVGTSPTIWAKILVPGGDYLSISTSLSNSYTKGETVILVASIKNTALTPTQVTLQITSTSQFSESRTLTIPAGTTPVSFSIGTPVAGSYNLEIKLYQNQYLLSTTMESFAIVDSAAINFMENEAESLKMTARNEFDEMAGIPASASSHMITDFGFKELKNYVGNINTPIDIVKKKDMSGTLTDANAALIAGKANGAIDNVGHKIESSTSMLIIRRVNEETGQNLPENINLFDLENSVSSYVFKIIKNKFEIIFSDAIKDSVVKPLFTQDEENKVVARNNEFNTYVNSNPFSVSNDENDRLIQRFNEGKGAIASVTESKALFTLGPYTYKTFDFDRWALKDQSISYSATLREQKNKFNDVEAFKGVIGSAIGALAVFAVIIVLVVSIVGTAGTALVPIIAAIPPIIKFLVTLSKMIPIVMAFMTAGMFYTLPIIAPEVTSQHDTTLDTIENIISSQPQIVYLANVYSNGSYIDRPSSVTMNIKNNEAAYVSPVTETMVFSPDGRIIDIIRSNPSVKPYASVQVVQKLNIPSKSGSYRVLGMVHSGSVATSIVSNDMTLTKPSIDIILRTDKNSYAVNDTTTIIAEFNNTEPSEIGNLTYVIEVINTTSVEAELMVMGASSNQTKTLIFTTSEKGMYIARATLLLGFTEIASKSVGFKYGNGSGLLLNIMANDLYAAEMDVVVPAVINNIGAMNIDSSINITTYDALSDSQQVYMSEIPVSIPSSNSLELDIPILPDAPPGIYRTILRVGNFSAESLEYTVVANGTIFTLLDTDKLYYNLSENMRINVTVNDVMFNATAASVNIIVSQPDETIISPSIQGDAGHYNANIATLLNGTYEISATSSKATFRSYNDETFTIVGQRSVLKTEIPINYLLINESIGINLHVVNEYSKAISNAIVTLSGVGVNNTKITDSNGNANFIILPNATGTLSFYIEKGGYASYSRNIDVIEIPTNPASVTNLTDISHAVTYINFTWLNPPDPDFSHIMLFLNGTFKTNITAPQNYYNFTGLDPDTLYELGTHTVDSSGNINQTWVNKTARTAPGTIPTITVIAPNGGETWSRGTTQTIRWTYSGTPGSYVRIELLKGGVLNRTINSSTSIGGSGSGSYSWLVNTTQTLGTDYKIRITSTTYTGYTDTSNNNFTISGGIAVTSPNGGENWARGTIQTIRWNYTGSLGSYVKIELMKNGAFNRTITSNTSLSRKYYNWTISSTQTPGTDYKVKITSLTNSAYNDTGDNNFTINAPIKSITVISPNGTENWARGTIQTIRWNYTGSLGSYVKIELMKNGAFNRTITSNTSLSRKYYNWTISSTQTPGADYKVKITSLTNSAYNDTGDNNFTINAPIKSITVISPNGTENWARGTIQTIRWNYAGSLGSYVKIELMKNGVFNRTITSNTSLSRKYYNWTISSTQTPGTDYKVKITSLTNSAYNDTSDNSFTINAPPTSITVLLPNGGESWARGTAKTITWTSSGSLGSLVKIELLKGGVLNRTINLSTPNDGSLIWTIPATQTLGADYKIRITSTSSAIYTDTSNANFTISSSTPSITVVSPNGGESWVRATAKTITWTSSGSPGSLVKIELFKGGVLNRTINLSTPNDGSHIWTIPSTQATGSNYKVKVTSTTNAAYTDSSNANFTISSSTASITVVSPNGGESWQRGTAKTITWTSFGSPGSLVKIELLKGGALNRAINLSTSNDGSHSWTIPTTQATGSNYKVRVTSTTNSAYTDTSNNNFTIGI